jgi:hypothetical protein
MADNLGYTAGAGTTIAADDISSVFYQRVKLSIGADGTAVDASAAAPVPVYGVGVSASATFTPAASSHTANDVVGGAQTFALGALSASVFMITDAELLINSGTAQATAWRLYLYNVTPPSATADDGAWDLPSGDQASFLGYIDLGTAIDMGSTQWIENHGVNKTVKLSGTGVFGYLVNLTTLTTAAVAHTVKLYGVPL